MIEKSAPHSPDNTSKIADTERSKEMRRFDFLAGEWDALCGSESTDGLWREGPGTLTATKALDGCVSIEHFEGPYCGSLIKGLGLRAFNLQSNQWEHTWTDSLEPGYFIVWRGRFEDDAIHLYGDWTDRNGQHVLSRLTWSQITQVSAHWVSHRSIDEGQTWKKHWEIQFRKRSNGAVGTTENE